MRRNRIFSLVLGLCLLVLPLSLALAQVGAAPARIYCKHFIFGYPLGAPASNPMIIRDLYALSMNGQTKLADWVCYHLTPHETQGTLDLKREWHNDPWLHNDENLIAEPKKKDEYIDAKELLQYDRGHMAPLASFKGSRYACQVNFYSNIMPQKADLNEGPWVKLEDKVRGLVDKYGHVWGMSGPLYERAMESLPKATKTHKVPSGFWMIVVASKKENPESPKDIKVAAFIMDQAAARNYNPKESLKPVAEVENRSKLNFFWELSASDQKALEAKKNDTWVQEWLQ
jgi:endonuclease G